MLGLDLPLDKLSAEEVAYCRQAVSEWKRLRPVLFSPMLYRLISPYDGKVFSGDHLMHVGLPLLTSGDMASRIVEVTRE